MPLAVWRRWPAVTSISFGFISGRVEAALRERLPPHTPAWPASVDANEAERDLLKKYVEATEAADFRALESIIREDATFRMPPEPGTAAGREPQCCSPC